MAQHYRRGVILVVVSCFPGAGGIEDLFVPDNPGLENQRVYNSRMGSNQLTEHQTPGGEPIILTNHVGSSTSHPMDVTLGGRVHLCPQVYSVL